LIKLNIHPIPHKMSLLEKF